MSIVKRFKLCFQSLKSSIRLPIEEEDLRPWAYGRKVGGRRPKLTIFDRLCIFFAYYRDYRTFEDIANDYNLATSTVFDTISLVEKTLSAKFTLPKREELAKNPPELIMIDTTEIEIEQPKKRGLNTIPARKNVIR